MAIPSIANIVKRASSAQDSGSDAALDLGRYHIRPLVRQDGTIDRKSEPFLKVRADVEAAYVVAYASRPRIAKHITVSVENGYTLKRLQALHALSMSVMKKMSKTDADWVVATSCADAVRRYTNRLITKSIEAVMPPKPKKAKDKAKGKAKGKVEAGTPADDMVVAPTSDTVIAAIQNCAASMPDASSLAVFIQKVATLAKSLESDRKAGRAILTCEV